ncbi:MAG: hypothetical protein N3A55_10665 [Methylohalobius sp.]|nr:hypothetical protein [Methylohalobius sp.]
MEETSNLLEDIKINYSAIFIIAFVALLVGCAAGSVHVNIDSISTPNADIKKKYILLPGLKDVESTDLQFKEYAGYIEKGLTSKGYVKAENFGDADIAIFLAYGIGEPQEHLYTYSLPEWGQTGILASTTFGAISTYGNHGTYRGTTTYIP